MDRSEIKAIVEGAIGPLSRQLGIQHWTITVSYDLRSDSDGSRTEAQCTRLVDYNKAWIEFDPEQFDDEQGVLATLRHELFHVVLSPFDLFTASVTQAIGDDEVVAAVLDRIQAYATEKAVVNLERMYAGLSKDEATSMEG